MNKNLKRIILCFTIFLCMICSSKVFAYFAIQEDANNMSPTYNIYSKNTPNAGQFARPGVAIMAYMRVQGEPYEVTYKTMQNENKAEPLPDGFIVYCMDHIFPTPSYEIGYHKWSEGANIDRIALLYGYPNNKSHSDFSWTAGDNFKDYYVTNVVLHMIHWNDFLDYDGAIEGKYTNLPAKDVLDNKGVEDPEGLRPYIMNLYNYCMSHDIKAEVSLSKITSLTLDGNSYLTNRIEVSPSYREADIIKSYTINLSSGITVESQDATGFVLRIPASLVNSSNLANAISQCNVVAKFDGGNSAILGGNYQEQRLVALIDSSVSAPLQIDVGSLKIVKKDSHNNPVPNVEFHIAGPSGTYDVYTNENGEILLESLFVGSYTITEVNFPDEYNFVQNNWQGYITISPGQETTYSLVNHYQRGSTSLRKYNNTGFKQNEYMKLSGAVYTLYAGEDIYEGNFLCYRKDQVVKSNIVTKEDGSIDAITDLPIGKYYFKEVTPSEGFALSKEIIETEVRAGVKGVEKAEDDFVEAPEEGKIVAQFNKYLTATDYDPKRLLEDCLFSFTLIKSDGTLSTDPKEKFYTNVTGLDGFADVDIPYGKYRVHEEECPSIALPVPDFDLDYTINGKDYKENILDGEPVTYDLEDISKKMKIKVRKTDIDRTDEAVDWTQGDAKLQGAIYQLYRYNVELDGYTYMCDLTVDHKDDEGYWCAESGWLLVGKYCVKEKIKRSEIVDGKQVDYSYAEGYMVDPNTYYFEQQPELQEVEFSYHADESKEEVVRGRLYVVKNDDDPFGSDENIASGAVLRLTLDSNPSIWYEVEVNEFGWCEFLATNEDEIDFNDVRNKSGIPEGTEGDEKFQKVKDSFGNEHKRSQDTINAMKYFPYTIPYGKYTITEVEEPHSGHDFYIQAEDVEIGKANGKSEPKQGKTEYRIEADEPVPFYFKLEKHDEDTGAIVKLTGAKFKIWDCQNNTWLSQRIEGSGEYIEEYATNDEGYLLSPQEVYPGDYIIYETQVPYGYYFEDSLRIPEDESKIGNEEYGGKRITVLKDAVGIPDDEEFPLGGVYTGKYVYTVEIDDRPLKGKLEIYKTGEMFTGILDKEFDVHGDILNGKVPSYSQEGLNGVTFKITAKEDIMSSDGTTKYRDKGWSTTMTTGENGNATGYATSEELYNGTYTVEEIDTPVGYRPCEPFDITINNDNPLNRVRLYEKEAENEYIPADIELEKIFEKTAGEDAPLYKTSEEEKELFAIFGIYNVDELRTVNGNSLIEPDTLLGTITVYDGKIASETLKLPDGDYYFEELYAEYPYLSIDDATALPHRYDFTINHKKDDFKNVKVHIKATNTFPYGDLYVVKVSATGVTQAEGLLVTSSDADDENIQRLLDEYSNKINEQLSVNQDMNVIDAVKATIERYEVSNNYALQNPAKYGVYLDELCTKPLERSYDNGTTWENVILVPQQDEAGNYISCYVAKGIPEGVYYVKELEAPVYNDNDGNALHYEVSSAVKRVVVQQENMGDYTYNTIFRVFADSSSRSTIEKQDIFTGRPVPNCLFTITDEEGSELLKFVTNEKGLSNIPTDIFEDGKKYYFTELSAPDFPYYEDGVLYELNTVPHEFTAHVDENGNWKYEDEEGTLYERPVIENYRPVSRIELKKTDKNDDTLLKDAKFTLESVETDWRLEGTTDENGTLVFEDVPYGEYVLKETEAPEGYILDTEEINVTVDKKDIVLEITNEEIIDVDTSDINILVTTLILTVSILGLSICFKKAKE